MKREIKKGDVMYLGLIQGIIMDDNPCSNETFGITLKETNGNFFWIQMDMESSLSYTPYTISQDGKLEGFTYQKPWQPQHGEPVWVRDVESDNWQGRVFKEMRGNLYQVYSYMDNNGDTLLESNWKYCKPFNVTEYSLEKETKTLIPATIPQQGDLVIVWDDGDSDNRKIRVFHSMSVLEEEWNVLPHASMHTNKDNKFYTPSHWDNYTPYIPLEGVIPVMVQFRDNGDKVLMLQVDNQAAVNEYSEIQGLRNSNYFHTGKGYAMYETYSKNKFKFD